MTRPLLPPDFVKTPIGLLFDPDLSPTLKITWQQLRAMAWGKTETPPFTAAEFEEMTGTDVKTLYKHMGALRAHGAFRWHRGNGSTFIVSFECDDQPADHPPEPAEILKNENSQNGELPLSLDLDQKLDQPDQKMDDSQKREFSKLRKPASAPVHKPDQKVDLMFEALADITNRTPLGRDWRKLPGPARSILNKTTAELRKVGATPEQVRKFPSWFKDLGKRDYRYRITLEPWTVVKLWTAYINDTENTHGLDSDNLPDQSVEYTPEQIAAAEVINAEHRQRLTDATRS